MELGGLVILVCVYVCVEICSVFLCLLFHGLKLCRDLGFLSVLVLGFCWRWRFAFLFSCSTVLMLMIMAHSETYIYWIELWDRIAEDVALCIGRDWCKIRHEWFVYLCLVITWSHMYLRVTCLLWELRSWYTLVGYFWFQLLNTSMFLCSLVNVIVSFGFQLLPTMNLSIIETYSVDPCRVVSIMNLLRISDWVLVALTLQLWRWI